MSAGLNDKQVVMTVDKTEYVNDNGILLTKRQMAAKKAWKTRRKNKKPYSIRKNKKKIHDLIEKYIRDEFPKTSDILPCTVFSLETNEFNLPLRLNGEKEYYNFYIAQNNFIEYNRMINNKPDNVKFLYYGNISEFNLLNIQPNVIFLDFCKTFDSVCGTIKSLSHKIDGCNFLFLTLCLRKNKKEIDDYKFDLSNKIFNLFPRFRIKNAITYRDVESPPMIFFVLENKAVTYLWDEHKKPIFDEELCLYVIRKLKNEYQDIYKMLEEEEYHRPHEMISCMCYMENQKFYNTSGPRYSPREGYEDVLEKLYADAISDGVLLIPKYDTSMERLRAGQVYDNMTFFSYFLCVIDNNLSDVWCKIEKKNFWYKI